MKVEYRPAADVAIIVLSENVPFADSRIVRLAENNTSKGNRQYVVAGWGLQLPKVGGSISQDRKLLVSTALKFVSAGSKSNPIQLSGTVTLPTGEELSVAACHGDSGGPTLQLLSLSSMSDIQKIELIGVTTAYAPSSNLPEELKPPPEKLTTLQKVERCAVPGSRSLSASVAAHRKWIDDTILFLRKS
jgi:hypothetical protein